MLLHLPIAILATLSPIAVSDTVPRFDVIRECRFEGGSTGVVDRCTEDEAAALQQLRMEWSQFASTDTKACTVETRIGGFESYVELLTCLEMESYRKTGSDNFHGLQGGFQFRPMWPAQPGMRVGGRADPSQPKANAKTGSTAAADARQP